MKFFRPRIERFEARRLMAGDVVSSPTPQVDSNVFMASAFDVAEQSTAESTSEDIQYIVANPIIDYMSDSVVARSGSWTVVASRLYADLLIVDESNLGSPKVASRLKLNIGIQDVKVDGQRAIVYGQADDDRTQVIAIDLLAGKVVNRVSFGPGQFSLAHLRGDDAWVVWNPTVNPAVNPNEQCRLIHLQWSEAGLVEKDSLPVKEGTWSVSDSRLILSTSNWQGGNTYDSTIHLYDISSPQLSELAKLELTNSFAKSIYIARDGQSATLIRGLKNPLVDPQTSVDLLDLSEGSIRIERSITINDATEVYRHDGDLAVLFGQYKRQVVSVDLHSDSLDQMRMHSWELPEETNTNLGVVSLGNGRLGIPAYVFHNGPFFSETSSSTEQLADGNYLWVLDPATGGQQMVRVELSGSRFFSLEPGTNRIGIWGASGDFSTFIYGELNDQFEFVKEGQVTGAVDRYRDVPVVSANRLLTAYSDQIAIYDLENAGKNLLITSVPDKVEELKAINHDVRVPKAGMLLQPFDPFDFTLPSSTRIHLIALEGAPAGVEITDARTITFPAYTESDKQPIDFDYVISNGITQARGHIHVVFAEPLDPWIRVDVRNTTTSTNSSTLRHNAVKPLDVNEDGIVTVLDVLLVINAINDGSASVPVGAIDTNGDGMLQAIDVLLVVNHLNLDPTAATAAGASEEELNAIRAAALKEELALYFPNGATPTRQLLVGFEPPVEPPPEVVTAVYWTPTEITNQFLQKLEVLPNELVSQPGLKEFNLGSPKLAVFDDGIVRNVNTNEMVDLWQVGRPRDVDGLVYVNIDHGVGTYLGQSGFQYALQRIDGQWRVMGRVMTYIS